MTEVTGTCGSVALSASPTFTGTVNTAALTMTGLLTNTSAGTSSFTGNLSVNQFASFATSTFPACHATSSATSTIAGGLRIVGGGLRVDTLNSSDCDLKASTAGIVTCGSDATSAAGITSSKFATSTIDANAIYTANALKVGIGSTTPWAKLSIAGGALADSRTPLFSISSSTLSATTTIFHIAADYGVSIAGSTTINAGAGTGLTILGRSTTTEATTTALNVGSTFKLGSDSVTSLSGTGLLITGNALSVDNWTTLNNKISSTSIDTCSEFILLMTEVTGTCGSVALSASPTFTGTVNTAALTMTGLLTNTSAGTSSFTGNLSVNQFASFATSTFPAFHATSSATSTIAGGLRIVGGGLRVDTLNSSDCDLKASTAGIVTCGTDATSAAGITSSKFATSTIDANAIYTANALKVGIGSTTPWAKLSIAGGALADSRTPLFSISSSTLSATTTIFHIAADYGVSIAGSTTINAGAGTGLTILGRSTTTEATTTALNVGSTFKLGSDSVTSLSGTGLLITGNALSVDNWTTLNNKISSTSIDTCSEFILLMTEVTGTCGSVALSASPTFTGTVNTAALTMTGLFTHTSAGTSSFTGNLSVNQ